MSVTNCVTVHGTHCCGMKEIDRLCTAPTPEAALRKMFLTEEQGEGRTRLSLWKTHSAAYRSPFCIYTGVTRRVKEDHVYSGRTDDYGQIFADYVQKHNLGVVMRSVERVNPVGGGNGVSVFVWAINFDTLIPFLENLQATTVAPTSTIKKLSDLL